MTLKLTARKTGAAIGTGLMGIGTAANAALPTELTGAITDMGVDLKTAGVAVIVAMAAFWAIKVVGSKLGLWARG